MANFSMRQRKEDISVIISGARSLKIDLRDQKQKKYISQNYGHLHVAQSAAALIPFTPNFPVDSWF